MDLKKIKDYFLTDDRSQVSNGEIKDYNGNKYYIFWGLLFYRICDNRLFNKNDFPLTGDTDIALIQNISIISILILAGLLF